MNKRRKTRHKLKNWRFSKTNTILIILLATLCGIAVWIFHEIFYNGAADDWFEKSAINGAAIVLPEDDGPHQTARESWVFNGHLRTESGESFSFHYAVFLTKDLVSHMATHASLVDHQNGKQYTAQHKTVWNSFASTNNRFEFVHGDWLMLGGNGEDRLQIVTDDFSFDLSLTSNQAPIFHGENGIISAGNNDTSHYYTRPRMTTSGTLTIGETAKQVTGISWFDHQWGEFSVGLTTRAWLGLQLKDGIDVMIYRLANNVTSPSLYGGSISHGGITEILLEDDLTVVPGKKWTSSKSSISYPLEWKLDIPSKKINVTIQEINENNEFDAVLTSYNFFWKGPVKVHGSHTGLGFMILNYMDKKN